ncbi:DUF481 domain-containing protein [Horticoccus luteus]|uniref:DUF481 domain-containing protein n=1 Tax=Horticoccus luteus TaxID=2862869 RepID=A0A8F9TS89_9BACT|nr:DUF481 domain-containing protein [Horticoccus luteus]QYM78269.1 DUF481 domain-containing protein [Horticoccus luteus]
MKLCERPYVETRVSDLMRRTWKSAVWSLALLVGSAGWARAADASGTVVPVPAKPALDELVYNDGDRVGGHLVEKAGDVIVFRSERFGLLRVPVKDAEVILAEKPKEVVAAKTPPAPGVTAEEAEEESTFWLARAPFSPRAMALALRKYFGAWHGRFSFSADMASDTATRNSAMVEAKVQRKWTSDEVQINGRYDFSSVDNSRSTDIVRANASYRHDLPHKLFFTYRPTIEWNRAYFINNVPADYVLLQEELGVGVNLVNTTAHKVRVGVSENVFDSWQLTQGGHNERNIESLFGEWEAKLPWRITLNDRAVYYYALANQDAGWENRFEINKKLTETLTVGVRHEVRYNNPDVRASDYRLLRLMIGFDF